MWNYAFIDNQNLYQSIKGLWRCIDYKKLRVYLKDKFNVEQAYMFIWYMPSNQALYTSLQQRWFIVIFKPTLPITKDWRQIIKWNCDAELVLHTMIEINNFEKAVIVSWDGDFHCLIEYLYNNNKLQAVGIPNKNDYSSLLRKYTKEFFYISDLKSKIRLKNI
jgi:uncharacterized LabA/DUF88 family protein